MLWALGALLISQALDPAVEADLILTLAAEDVPQPTTIAFLPDGRMVVASKTGALHLYDGAELRSYGNIEIQGGGERGLLNIAVDPDFVSNRRLYFYYSAGGAQRVAWAALDDDPVVTSSLTVILDGLASDRLHNGGGLAFGGDGNLYIGVGDTGCGDIDPGATPNNWFATCLATTSGKILRVTRDGDVPLDNPLVGTATVAGCPGDDCGAARRRPQDESAPETAVFAWGLRNPWRIAVAPDGALWVGDVGADAYEEVTVVAAGEHHGWPFREGQAGRDVDACIPYGGRPCVDPLLVYGHEESPGVGQASVTGGVFTNHCSWPEPWRGRYWFADYLKGRVWTLTSTRTTVVRNLAGVVHFTEGPDGRLWMVSLAQGQLWTVAPSEPADCDPPVPDAGVPVDASAPLDAAELADAAEPRDAVGSAPEDRSDCGCTSARGAPSVYLLLIAWASGWRRTRLRGSPRRGRARKPR